MAACVDVPRWANFRQDTCAKYASKGLCAGGRVVDANASGSVFGYPERACCACGRSETMRRAEANDRVSSVDQIVLLATHVVDRVDARIWGEYYAPGIRRSLPQTELWLLAYHETAWPPVGAYYETADERARFERKARELVGWQATHTLQTCLWSNRDVAREYPAMRSAATLLPKMESQVHLRRYYWFHASLGVFRAVHGHAYPNVRYFWRIEPDVVPAWAGTAPLAGMLAAAARASTADVLLPQTCSQVDCPWYPHFGRPASKKLLAGIPEEKRLWTLVCVGRYSAAFVRGMEAEVWRPARIAYEEVLLPTRCRNDRNCVLERLVHPATIQWKPDDWSWSCNDVISSARRDDGYIFHPMKARACYLEYLDALRDGRDDEKYGKEAPFRPTWCEAHPEVAWCHGQTDDPVSRCSFRRSLGILCDEELDGEALLGGELPRPG